MKKPLSPTDAFEQVIASARVKHVFRLYVGGTKANSIRALQAIKELCEEHLQGKYDLEIIDIFQDKDAAKGEQIVAVPTLVRLEPKPVRKFVGDLSDREKLLSSLVLIRSGGSK